MSPALALAIVLAVLLVAVAAGFLWRARSGKRRTAHTGDLTPDEVDLERFGELATVVQFSTEMCARCPGVHRALSAAFDARDDVAFAHVDLTHDRARSARFHVLQTPTVLVIDRDGHVRSRYGGAIRPRDIETEVASLQEGTHV